MKLETLIIPPDISIILTGAEGQDVSACLEGLAACVDPVAVEVFLPETASNWQRWQQALHITILPDSGSQLLPVAWSQATGRYLAAWRHDVVAAPGCLRVFLDFLDEHPDVGAVGPRFFNPQGDILSSAFRSNQPYILQDRPPVGWDGLSSQEVAWLSGTVLLVNAHALGDVGLPRTKRSCWERHYCRRLQSQGWHIHFCHLARVTCHLPLPLPPSLLQRCWHNLVGWLNKATG